MSDERFRIRPATLSQGDDKLLVEFFNSQLAWLSSVGSNDQWGSNPASPERAEHVRSWFTNVESTQNQKTAGLDYCHIVVAEVRLSTDEQDVDLLALSTLDESTGSRWVPAGGLVFEGRSAHYVRDILEEQSSDDPFVYLSYLLSDRRASIVNKGVGGALIAYGQRHARDLNVSRICADCFAGNDRKLVKFYESQGFKAIGDFAAGEHSWPGTVLELRL